QYLNMTGFWGPIIFMILYAAGVCLFIPDTLLTGLGAAIFCAYWGFVYVWGGAMIGASVAFFIGRTLGRAFAASLNRIILNLRHHQSINQEDCK
ncbi:MAG: hypothetical protein PVG06_06375, partial [Desulfobacterales bacterium]